MLGEDGQFATNARRVSYRDVVQSLEQLDLPTRAASFLRQYTLARIVGQTLLIYPPPQLFRDFRWRTTDKPFPVSPQDQLAAP
jgi:hypothetical protein